MKPVDIKKARQFIRNKELRRKAVLSAQFQRACLDFQKIVKMMIDKYNPERIYQWGSLLNERSFSEISDIDIAVEGVSSAEMFFKLYGDAMVMTSFRLDIVEIEKIEPEFRGAIIENGKLIYERKQ